MEVLVVGWSDIVRRRVLPALGGIDQVSAVHLSTTYERANLGGVSAKAGRTYTGSDHLDAALTACPSAVVYVSGTNASHVRRTLAALASGHDVIVDKPAFLDEAGRRACLDAAQSHGLLLAEATVWPFHEQVAELRRRLTDRGLRPERIVSTFTIPVLAATNFRTQATLGGGVLSDMGAYAMSPGRIFGNTDLVDITGEITQRSADGLDLAFHMRAEYADDLLVDGTFSMNADYANQLELMGAGWAARLQPAFSSRADARLDVALTIGGVDHSFRVDPCDSFAEFLRAAIGAIAADDRADRTQLTARATGDLILLARTLGARWPGLESVD